MRGAVVGLACGLLIGLAVFLYRAWSVEPAGAAVQEVKFKPLDCFEIVEVDREPWEESLRGEVLAVGKKKYLVITERARARKWVDTNVGHSVPIEALDSLAMKIDCSILKRGGKART